MAEITAAAVAKLREMTGAGLMECKKALIAANGDLQLAVDILRKSGAASAAKKSSRDANEGVIVRALTPDNRAGSLVEVNCETDFVARNEAFGVFCDEVAKAMLANPKADLEATRTAQVAKIGENIQISRSHRMEVKGNGIVTAYIHTGAKVGVLVEIGAGKEATTSNEEFKQLAKDITLQIAAGHPFVVSGNEMDPAVIAKEKEIAAEQVKNKPPQAVAKIIEGKLEKFYQGYCLLDQGFVKGNSDVRV